MDESRIWSFDGIFFFIGFLDWFTRSLFILVLHMFRFNMCLKRCLRVLYRF